MTPKKGAEERKYKNRGNNFTDVLLRTEWIVRVMDVYMESGMCSNGEMMNCGVVEVVKHNTLMWFGLLENGREQDDKETL